MVRRRIISGQLFQSSSFSGHSGAGKNELTPFSPHFPPFEEVDKSKTPAGVKIVDGKYALQVQPGSKVVRITASRPTKKPDPVMGAAARESMIAKEFNENTTLKAAIQPGQNEA